MAGKAYLLASTVCCPHHHEAPLIEDWRAGDQICSQCGLVVGDRSIDVGAEWRSFSSDTGGQDRSRVGGTENPLLSCDLSTTIGPTPPGAAQTYNSKPYNSQDRSLRISFRTIAEMADRINLSRTVEDKANSLLKMVFDGEKKRGRGWSNEAYAAACLYIACRQEEVPRTFKEIVAVSTVKKTKIQRCFQHILQRHSLRVEGSSAEDYLARFCGELSLPREVETLARAKARLVQERDLVPGRSPVTVAAGVLHLLCQAGQERRSLAEIAQVTGVSQSAILGAAQLLH